MITHDMLDVYCAFSGDIDGYARLGRPQQRLLVDDAQWREIAVLLQELFLLVGGQVSANYGAAIRQRMAALVADPSVEARLLALARDARAPD